MNDLFIPLTIGETYTVSDFYGMMAWEGVYRGVLEDENAVAEPEQILLFRKHDQGYPWAGVIAEPVLTAKGVHINLRAHYYGKTARSLKHVTQGDRDDRPKWVKQT